MKPPAVAWQKLVSKKLEKKNQRKIESVYRLGPTGNEVKHKNVFQTTFLLVLDHPSIKFQSPSRLAPKRSFHSVGLGRQYQHLRALAILLVEAYSAVNRDKLMARILPMSDFDTKIVPPRQALSYKKSPNLVGINQNLELLLHRLCVQNEF